MLVVTLAVQFAFMLPVATPPNAVAFMTGKIQVIDLVCIASLKHFRNCKITYCMLAQDILLVFSNHAINGSRVIREVEISGCNAKLCVVFHFSQLTIKSSCHFQIKLLHLILQISSLFFLAGESWSNT